MPSESRQRTMAMAWGRPCEYAGAHCLTAWLSLARGHEGTGQKAHHTLRERLAGGRGAQRAGEAWTEAKGVGWVYSFGVQVYKLDVSIGSLHTQACSGAMRRLA